MEIPDERVFPDAYLAFANLARRVSGGRLGRYRFVRGLKGAIERALFRSSDTAVRVRGLTMYVKCDGISLGAIAAYRSGDYEGFMTELFLRDVRLASTIIDVGANFGYYTLLAARAVGPEGRVYSFEPSPDETRLLSLNIRANGFENVSVETRAASNTHGTVLLHTPAEGYLGFNTLYPPAQSHHQWRTVTVSTVSVDEIVAEAHADVVKIDVEGAEWEVLEGMSRLIHRSPDMKLYLEFNPVFLSERGMSPECMLRQLEVLGFEVSLIDEDERRLVPLHWSDRLNEKLDLLRGHNLRCVKTGNGARIR